MQYVDVSKCVCTFLLTIGTVYLLEPVNKNIDIFLVLFLIAGLVLVPLGKRNIPWHLKQLLILACIKIGTVAESFVYHDDTFYGAITIAVWLEILWLIYEMSSWYVYTYCPTRELFASRQCDLELCKNVLLNERNIKTPGGIGIVARWGDGKSYFVDALLSDYEICNAFHIIRFNVIAINIDYIPQALINELYAILREEGTPVGAIVELRQIFKRNSRLKSIGDLIFPKQKFYSSIFQSIAADVQKLRKPILLVYDDVDRIQKIETFMNLASISDELSRNTGGKIQVLYQYDKDRLLRMDDNKDMMEELLTKYITREIWLSPVLFYEMMHIYLKELREQYNEEIENKKAKDWTQTISRIVNDIHENLVLYADDDRVKSVQQKNYSARKVREFANDLWNTLGENFEKICPEVIGSVVYARHFLKEAYHSLRISPSLYESVFLETETGKLISPQNAQKLFGMPIFWTDKGNEEKYIFYHIMHLIEFSSLFERQNEKESDNKSDEENVLYKYELHRKYDQYSNWVTHLIYSGKTEKPDIDRLAEEIQNIIHEGKEFQLNDIFLKVQVHAELKKDLLENDDPIAIIFHVYRIRNERKDIYKLPVY